MSAPFRISGRVAGVIPVARGGEEDLKLYLDRLLKMIPAEVVSLYLVGTGFIPEAHRYMLIAWAVVCLVGVLVIRAYGTADPIRDKKVDWIHVAISSVAFVVWVYTLGGPFKAFDMHVPYVGSLLVLTWTFFVPVFYKGPPD